MKEEILSLIRERGLLLEKGVFEILENFSDPSFAKDFLVNIEKVSGQKFISLNLLGRNIELVNSAVRDLPGEQKSMVENTFVKLGLSLEIRKEREIVERVDKKESIESGYRIFYADTKPNKKLEVRDFSNHFRARYGALQ